VVEKFVKAKIEIANEVDKVSKVSKVDSGNLLESLNELAEFEIDSNKKMALIDKKNLDLLEMAERPSDVKAIMETHIKHREARLGKSPETAIQINNNINSIDDIIDSI
jgi:nucleoid DNA-binding protein